MTPPILESERLSFRLMSDADEADLERLDSDPDVRAFFPGGTTKRPTSRERIAHNLASYAQHGVCDFIVLLRRGERALHGGARVQHLLQALHAQEPGARPVPCQSPSARIGTR